MTSAYPAVFAELKDALRAVRHAEGSPSPQEILRLQEAVSSARTLIQSNRLRTRAEAAAHGALRRGMQYLEERDLANLTDAETLLRTF